MLHWNKNPNRHVAAEADRLSDYPTGGPLKLAMLGILLPGYLFYHAAIAWFNQVATWYGRGGDIEVFGPTARSLAVVYACVGLLCHFRWFWGLLGRYRVFEVGSIVSLLGFSGGLFVAFVFALFIG